MAGYEGLDALLAAITDEPLPEGARDDAEFMAEHGSAVADVALLREQLRIMGDVLAAGTTAAEASTAAASGAAAPGAEGERPEPETSPSPSQFLSPYPAPAPLTPSKPRRGPTSLRAPKPVRPARPSWRRRHAGVALGTLVVAAGTAMLGGMVWLGVQGGRGADDSDAASGSAAKHESGAGDSAYSPGMRIACSKVLVEGTVQSVTSAGEGNVRVVLKVKRYYRPEQSVADRPTITVTLLASAREDLKVGTYTLVRVPVYPEDRQDWETGRSVGDAREGILEALPGAQGMECSGPPGSGG